MLKSNHDEHIKTDDPELWWKLKQQHEHKKNDDNENKQTDMTAIPPFSRKKLSFISHFKIQLYIAVVLFIIFVFIQHLNSEQTTKVVGWLEKQMNNQIEFVAISTWYENTFSGSPSFIPTFDNKSQQVMSKDSHDSLPLPVQDSLVIRTFADSLTGLELATEQGADVLAVDEGRVVFVRDEGDTVIIQHSNQYVSIYSKMALTSVELNQWIKQGDKIGSMSQTQQKPLLFYAIKKENDYIDPLGVVSFD